MIKKNIFHQQHLIIDQFYLLILLEGVWSFLWNLRFVIVKLWIIHLLNTQPQPQKQIHYTQISYSKVMLCLWKMSSLGHCPFKVSIHAAIWNLCYLLLCVTYLFHWDSRLYRYHKEKIGMRFTWLWAEPRWCKSCTDEVV